MENVRLQRQIQYLQNRIAESEPLKANASIRKVNFPNRNQIVTETGRKSTVETKATVLHPNQITTTRQQLRQ